MPSFSPATDKAKDEEETDEPFEEGKQKNENNGEIIPYERDVERLDLCPVYAALRIRQRALRLAVAADHPIGVYKPKKLSTRVAPGVGYHYITRDQVEKYLRSIGALTFSLPKTDPMVSRWSSHLIRVTACTCCIDKDCRIHTSSNASAGKASHGAITSATQSTLLPSTRRPSNSQRATFLLSLTRQQASH